MTYTPTIDPMKHAIAAKSLRDSIQALDGEDEILLLDTIEGETGLFEAVDALLNRMLDNRARATGLDSVIADLTERKRRFERRVDTDRALIEQAMGVAELPKLERPIATLSLAKRAPGVEVTDEAAIPAEFWKTGNPTLDKKALGAALKARAEALEALPSDPGEREAAMGALPPEIPGATLSNGAPSLSARFK